MGLQVFFHFYKMHHVYYRGNKRKTSSVKHTGANIMHISWPQIPTIEWVITQFLQSHHFLLYGLFCQTSGARQSGVPICVWAISRVLLKVKRNTYDINCRFTQKVQYHNWSDHNIINMNINKDKLCQLSFLFFTYVIPRKVSENRKTLYIFIMSPTGFIIVFIHCFLSRLKNTYCLSCLAIPKSPSLIVPLNVRKIFYRWKLN